MSQRIDFYLAVVIGLVTVFGFIIGFLGRQTIVNWVEKKTESFVKEEVTEKVGGYVDAQLEAQSDAALQEYMNKFKAQAQTDLNTFLKIFETELEKLTTARRESETLTNEIRELIKDSSLDTPPTQEERQKLSDAAKTLAETKSTAEYTAEEWLLKGLTAYQSGDYESARDAWTKTIELQPDYAGAYNNRGLTYDDLKRYDEALNDYNKAIELNPDYAGAYNNRGLTYDNQQRYDEALNDFNKAIELNPDYAKAYYNRGLTYSKQQRYDETLNDYNKAIELNPDYADAYNNRGNTYDDLKRYDEALNDFNKAIELEPDHVSAYYNRGTIYGNQQRYDEALNNFNKAIELKPDHATAYNNRGLTYQNQKRYDEALNDYNKAIELKPDYADAYKNLAELHIVAHQPEQALAKAEHVLSISEKPGDQAIGVYLKCLALRLLGRDTDEAETQLSALLAQSFEWTWSFQEIKTWVEEADLEPAVKQFIQEKTAMMEKHQRGEDLPSTDDA